MGPAVSLKIDFSLLFTEKFVYGSQPHIVLTTTHRQRFFYWRICQKLHKCRSFGSLLQAKISSPASAKQTSVINYKNQERRKRGAPDFHAYERTENPGWENASPLFSKPPSPSYRNRAEISCYSMPFWLKNCLAMRRVSSARYNEPHKTAAPPSRRAKSIARRTACSMESGTWVSQ